MASTWARRALPSAVFVSMGVVVATLFVSSLRPPTPAEAQGASDTPKALFEAKCAACHNLPNPKELQYTRRQWQTTVNQMLYQKGALYNPQTHSGVTVAEAQEIVGYLAQFAPRRGRQAPMNPTDTGAGDVWTTEPIQSRSFTFTSADGLSDFDSSGGAWKIVPSDSAGEGYLKVRSQSSAPASLLIEKKDAVTGDMDLRVSFKPFQPSAHSAVGLVIDYHDSRDYSVIEFDPAAQTLRYVVVSQGAAVSAQTQDLAGTSTAGPDGWHTLRVVTHNNGQSITAWLDFQKRLAVNDPNAKSGSHVGLFAGTNSVAAFRLMSLDIYAPMDTPGSLD
ncbi:MAG TPA: cytochrome c [Capsulimonadaceae bacterium]|nr:cytochrome c [Capsulimonadaceae bacterium]